MTTSITDLVHELQERVWELETALKQIRDMPATATADDRAAMRRIARDALDEEGA